jgi:hypothetical protein
MRPVPHLRETGIATVGAGPNAERAGVWHVTTTGERALGILGVTDHPPDFAAGRDTPSVAHADLNQEVPPWLRNPDHQMTQEVDTMLVPRTGGQT